MIYAIRDERKVARSAAQQPVIVTVLFTSMRPTLTALQQAGALASQLGACIRVLDICVVPWPLPLDEPSVNCNYVRRRFQTLAGEQSIPTNFEIRLCRDRMAALRAALPARSLLLVGGRRRWWPTREMRLARALKRAGHEVIFVQSAAEEQHA